MIHIDLVSFIIGAALVAAITWAKGELVWRGMFDTFKED